MTRKVILTILDGFGFRTETKSNAIAQAKTPTINALSQWPFATLEASGLAVGLPKGQMGNSEVGHTNIGAGRIVYQDLTRINKTIEEGSFDTNPVLTELAEKLSKSGGKLHLLGLVSPGGVHSSMDHLYALLRWAKMAGIPAFLHAFLDGRDTPPSSALGYISNLQKDMEKEELGKIGSVCGRFWAMDRDNRWDRVEKAYSALTQGIALKERDACDAIQHSYDRGETDEFVEPTTITDENENPVALIEDGDAILFFNFRSDRARELTMAFTFDDFDSFKREKRPHLAIYATMTQYREDFGLPIMFPPEKLSHILGEEISNLNLKQLRIAETEKYAHVTFFFNGGKETLFPGEERILIASPKVKTYDMQPEMSAAEVTDRLLETMNNFDFIVLNFANSDMVGHTGIFGAAVTAVEAVDSALSRIVPFAIENKWTMLITADHGNADIMVDEKTGKPHTAHTLSPVPFWMVNPPENISLRNGVLADIAPTILSLMEIKKPKEMTGKSLIN
ncbi:2,3-bisphosphoglycerate-independent phosphoglycerate mutase [bacterium]|nr:2,3-bisphosphoglycerate-independent phosphoglycerate mutase [bacterium]